MAQPPPFNPPPPLPYRPYGPAYRWGPQSPPLALLGFGVFMVLFVLVMIFIFTGMAGMGFVTPFDLFPFCGIFVFVIILVVVLVAAGMGGYRSTIPPPPPIQQPMVPAGMQGPVALNCPNCGAPPQGVDRFGVATCSYCNTRYLVR